MSTTFLAEGHHPRQGDKQEKTFLSCGVLPSRQHLWWAIYIRGRCPRLLMVVPSRHQSACGVQSVVEQKLPEDGSVYLCLSPCDGCKNPVGVMVWLTEKYPSLLERFSEGHSINGSQETSCINRKGFIQFLSCTQYPQANPSYPSYPSYPW